jgi:hypothetical protein
MLRPLTVANGVLLSDLEPLDRVESEPVVPPQLNLGNPRLASEPVHVACVDLPPLSQLLGGKELGLADRFSQPKERSRGGPREESVFSDTWTQTMRPACARPSETAWRQTTIRPVALTRR